MTEPRPDETAFFGQVYDELRAIARERMAQERRDHTLQATALVNEVWLRLGGQQPVPRESRAAFFAAAAEAMRRVLIDHARARGRDKRGGGAARADIKVADLAHERDFQETVSLDDAVRRLCQHDEEIGRVVLLRYFAGLSIEETAAVIGISAATTKRRWEFARTWLYRELHGVDEGASEA